MPEEMTMSLGLFEEFCPTSPRGGAEELGCLLASWETPILIVLGIGLVLLGVALFRRRRRWGRSTRFVLPPAPSGGRNARPRPRLRGLESGRSRSAAPDTSPPSVAAAPTTSPPSGEIEGTLQLLPARLEIEGGPGEGSHIRFVRLPGETQEFTLGRVEGDPHRHVRLDSPTVSRTHARLIHERGRWTLKNESSTNPTIHNGRELDSGFEVVRLRDGDRIELGEVQLVFRLPSSDDRLATRSSWYTDRGRRSVNMDAVLVKTLPDGRELAAVCDGIGSHAEGGVASHIAIDALVASMSDGVALAEAVRDANLAVLRAAEKTEEREGMGTTMVAMVRKDTRYEIANVGDSRAYRIDTTGLRRMTRDHSFVAEAVRDGRMSFDEASRSPWRDAVTRNLGAAEEVEVDVYGGYDGTDPFTLVLCTDGVHGALADDEIHRVVRETGDIRDLARALGEQALIRGGTDNVAVAAVRFGLEANGARTDG